MTPRRFTGIAIRFAGFAVLSLTWGLAPGTPVREHLTPCGHQGALCGHLRRPLDPAAPTARHVDVHFEFYPHSGSGKAAGTLVATEGGPGYATTESRDDYLALFRPLMREHDVLLVDNRGTGGSGALDCHALQTGAQWTVAGVGACGVSLGGTAALYSSALAADDLAAVLAALDVGQIDLYGDSYGTYFAQVFALRHPQALRSLVLDGAYPLTANDYAWYPTLAPATRDKFTLACSRDAACAAAAGASLDRIVPVLERLRAHPATARARDVDGTAHTFTADAAHLATLMFASAPALTSLRELDAAARAFTAGDAVPLLRLMAETLAAVDSRDRSADPKRWSAGLAAAVMCQDPPQVVDLALPLARRGLEHDRVLSERRATHPDGFAPFTLDEFRAMPLDYSLIDLCLDWPAPPAAHPAGHVVADDAPYPTMPVLVLSGEFDNITTVADGAAAAGRFAQGTQVVIANSFHVNALPRARSACAAGIVRQFVTALAPGDVSCAAQVPPLRLLPRFARESRELDPARPAPGNQASREQLQRVASAVYAAGDAVARLRSHSGTRGAGLRGGGYGIATRGSSVVITFDEVAWTEDVTVSGELTTSAQRDAVVAGRLIVRGRDGTAGVLDVRWQDPSAGGGLTPAVATIAGTLAGAPVQARMRAP